MKIASSSLMPAQTVVTAPASGNVNTDEPQVGLDDFKSGDREGNVNGLLSRAIYGAALYGMPALAGAVVPGNAGIVTGTLLGAGIGGATHLNSGKDAAIFAATGAVVGVGLSWVGNQLQSTPYAWAPVVASAIVGAGTQALFSKLHENNTEA